MDEFKPSKRDLLNIDSLIIDIKAKKSVVVSRKMSLQNSLSQMRDKMKKLPQNSKEFKRIRDLIENIKTHLNGYELKIKEWNDELSFKTKLRLEVDHYVRNNKPFDAQAYDILERLKGLKNKYTDFAKDRTRVASLRVMANEFITELETIIKNV